MYGRRTISRLSEWVDFFVSTVEDPLSEGSEQPGVSSGWWGEGQTQASSGSSTSLIDKLLMDVWVAEQLQPQKNTDQ